MKAWPLAGVFLACVLLLAGTPFASRASDYKSDISQDDWNQADSILLGKVRETFPVDQILQFGSSTEVTWLTLPFYRQDTRLVRVEDGWSQDIIAVYFLQGEDGNLIRLDGTAAPIHAFNALNALNLTDNTVKDYLWFFTFFVRADGPFLLIENGANGFLPSPYSQAVDNATRAAIRGAPKGTSCLRQPDGESFRCQATVYYSNALFKAVFVVPTSGAVEMLEDSPLAENLSTKIHAPISLAVQPALVETPTQTPVSAPSQAAVQPLPPPASQPSQCLTLTAQESEINVKVARLMLDNPGLHTLAAICGGIGMVVKGESASDGKAVASFLTCAAVSCYLTGVSNCASVAKEWVLLGIEQNELGKQKQSFSCSP